MRLVLVFALLCAAAGMRAGLSSCSTRHLGHPLRSTARCANVALYDAATLMSELELSEDVVMLRAVASRAAWEEDAEQQRVLVQKCQKLASLISRQLEALQMPQDDVFVLLESVQGMSVSTNSEEYDRNLESLRRVVQ